VVRRNMNRRHMTDDHHDRTARRATLLVRAVDEILGTHKSWQHTVARYFRGCSRGRRTATLRKS